MPVPVLSLSLSQEHRQTPLTSIELTRQGGSSKFGSLTMTCTSERTGPWMTKLLMAMLHQA